MRPKETARFIEPVLLLRTDALPNDAGDWEYQLKLDGYRAIAFKTRGRVHLRSRNDNDFSIRYPAIVQGLAKLPDETVIDGEVIALDEDGRPSFSVLQNYGSSKAPVVYFVFDVMMLAGQDIMNHPLMERRQFPERKVLPRLTDPVRYAGPLAETLPVLIESVKAQGLEGLVAKRLDSRYEWLADGCLAENADQPRARIRRWRLHGRGEHVRRVGLRVLRRRSADVCGSNAQRLYADRAPAGVQEVPRLGDQGVPVRQSA
jgi:ATP-dependent DNA ligase